MSIAVEKLSFSYCTRPVLQDVSFSAENGRLVAVLGPNGVGKTTLFRCILGLQRGYTGSIRIDGADARQLSARELAHRVAYIPQIHAQAFGFSVLDMVLMGTSHALSPLSVPKQGETDAAMAALERLGIAKLAAKNFNHLSGGEQQLTLIARALAQNARTLLMDEPTASLDYGNQAHVLSAVRALAAEGYTVVMSTHNPQQAVFYADLALALFEGSVAAYGAPSEVMDAALIERLYQMRIHLIPTEQGPVIVPAVERE